MIRFLWPFQVTRAVTVQLANGRWIVVTEKSTLYVAQTRSTGLVCTLDPTSTQLCFLPSTALGCVEERLPFPQEYNKGL